MSRIRDAGGGSRTHLKLLCRQLPCRLAPGPRSKSVPPGVEPGLRPSQSRVHPPHSKDIFITPPRNRTSPDCIENSHASSTLAGHLFSRVSRPGFEPGPEPSEGSMRSTTPSGRCVPQRADDWIRTSMNLFTRQAPFSVEPRRQCLKKGSGTNSHMARWVLRTIGS